MNVHPPSSFLLAFIAEQMSYTMEYSFGQLVSAFLGMSPPKILPNPSLLVREECWRDSLETLMLCEPCSAVAKTLMHYQHLSSY